MVKCAPVWLFKLLGRDWLFLGDWLCGLLDFRGLKRYVCDDFKLRWLWQGLLQRLQWLNMLQHRLLRWNHTFRQHLIHSCVVQIRHPITVIVNLHFFGWLDDL